MTMSSATPVAGRPLLGVLPRRKARQRRRGAALIAVCTIALTALMSMGGCASWDEQTYFPEDYQSTYTQAHACKKGAHPAGNYVTTWVNSIGKEAFEKGTTPYPEGTIFVKSQYADDRCTEQERFTVMKKGATDTAPDSGDWLWQLVGDTGNVGECCDGSNGCLGCHTPCKSNDWVCTHPEKK